MKKYGTTFLLAGLSIVAAGCDFKDDDDSGAAPAPASYTVAVTGVGMVNKDTGEALVVDGLPVQGGALTVK